ncbi:DUF4159 domain-containing protein [Parvularcula marina]|uniref:DUF4159 domain-containing protein n=1 Tax=Parvularcula marina TaxID=2292771 RepID=UPI003518243D
MAGLSFSAPLLLGALITLPFIWWLLRAMPPAPIRTRFGGMMFLEGLENRKETPSKTPWWLLLIRLAAIALLILGLAGPVHGARKDLDGDGPLLLIVDNSWPAAPRWRERQDVLRALAASPGASGRVVRILTTAGEPALSDPMTLRQAAEEFSGMTPEAALPDRDLLLDLIEEEAVVLNDVAWVTDGVIGRRGADREFLRRLDETGSLTVIRPAGQVTMAIRSLHSLPDGLRVEVERIGSNVDGGTVLASSADGRPLGEAPFTFENEEDVAEVRLTLPLTLRNEVGKLTIIGLRSAGATWLVDPRARRVRAGVVSDGSSGLLEGGFYIEQALADTAVINRGALGDLITEDTSLIILDDIGVIRGPVEDALLVWVRAGGTLVRFAGPNTSNAEEATGPLRSQSFPVALRGGARAFGGALSWTEPQTVAAFPEDSPFADMSLREPVSIRRQVLTRASTEPGYEVWAALEDGTPLITARPEGDGRLILFHVTSTPTWSDLPVSGVFPSLLGRIAQTAADVPSIAPTDALAPWRLLDGFGGLRDPGSRAVPASPEEMLEGLAAPGLYGTANSAFAVNTYGENAPTLDPLGISLMPGHAAIRGLDTGAVREFGPMLITLAMILMALDAISLFFRNRMVKAVTAAALIFAVAIPMAPSAKAQTADLRPEIDTQSLAAALSVRFAYVETGDADIDRVVRSGLTGLTREATRRSALEPAPPVGVDIEREDLSVYPLLYWVIRENTPPPSDGALSQLETFMAEGGLLIIDTMDGERQTDATLTPQGERLRRILLRMNIPPLEPLPADHILKKSFYRLDDLHGRNSGGPVWVEASSALRDSTDGVPSLIIGGREWAAAWATDELGRPLRSAGQGGELRREYAYRTGINMAMVALTGNYKEDQVHVQDLLDSLGEAP